MQGWAVAELWDLDLGDARRTRRVIQTVETLANQPEASVPHAAHDWAETKAIYRLFGNEDVDPEQVRAAHQRRTAERCQGHPLMLAVQDTTDLDLRHHPGTDGLGALGTGNGRGLKVHSTLAVSPDRVPLGLLNQQVWARDPEQTGQRHQRRQRSVHEKESGRWLTSVQRVEEQVDPETTVLHVADREADLFDLFCAPRRAGSELLIRLAQNRRVVHEARLLFPAMEMAPVVGEHRVMVGRRANRWPEPIVLQLKVETLPIEPPGNRSDLAGHLPVSVQVILAEETTPPAGVKPVRWLLLTTLPVEDVAAVQRCLHYYSTRWLIERYHYVLKSGCRIEDAQLKTASRMERALAIYSLVAWRLLWLTYQARQEPEAPCTVAFTTTEWQALYATVHQSTDLPDEPPSIQEAVRLLGRLGGFLGRRSDGEPGVKALWRGWSRLSDITRTWELAQTFASATPTSNDVGKA